MIEKLDPFRSKSPLCNRFVIEPTALPGSAIFNPGRRSRTPFRSVPAAVGVVDNLSLKQYKYMHVGRSGARYFYIAFNYYGFLKQ